MKGWICGLIAGIVMGSAVAGISQPPLPPNQSYPGHTWHGSYTPWQTLGSIDAQSEDFQKGYVEGIDDALRIVASAPTEMSKESMIEFVKKQEACLHTFGSSGIPGITAVPVEGAGTAEGMLRAARAEWRTFLSAGYSDYPAAFLLFLNVCPR